jgi:hypothetical protein
MPLRQTQRQDSAQYAKAPLGFGRSGAGLEVVSCSGDKEARFPDTNSNGYRASQIRVGMLHCVFLRGSSAGSM